MTLKKVIYIFQNIQKNVFEFFLHIYLVIIQATQGATTTSAAPNISGSSSSSGGFSFGMLNRLIECFPIFHM
jgi:hypothetical protein